MFIFVLHRADACVEEGYNVEHSTSILKRTLRNLAKDTMSVIVKLETKIEESTCGVLDYVMIFNTKHTPATINALVPSLGNRIAGCKSAKCLRRKGGLHDEVIALDSKTRYRRTTSS